jgi:anti-anti-sigma regulatory factor
LISVAEAHPERLVLDLGRLVFVDVAGVRALDDAHKALEAQCPVILRSPRPTARKSFSLTGHRED